MKDWLTQHASPRWLASKIFIENVPPDERDQVVEDLCLAFPTWFFELLTEFDGQPFVLEPFQIKYLLDDNLFKITNKTRQSGGSLQVSAAKFFKAYRNEGFRCDIVSINLKEATDKIRYIRNLHETLPMTWRHPLTIDNQLSIGFHRGNKQSIINSLAASAGVRGGRKELVFDEFAHIPNGEELFYAAAPAIMNGELAMDIVSTPAGNQNLFAQIYNNVTNEYGEKPFDFFSRHQFYWMDVSRFMKEGKYEECQKVWKEDFKQDMGRMRELVEAYASDKLLFFYRMFPYNHFLQEFCGAFLDEQNAFFPQSLIMQCLKPEPTGLEEGNVETLQKWYSRPDDNFNSVFMGVDFGESAEDTDKTSIQILERLPTGKFMHRYSEVLSKDDYPDFVSQAEHIADVYRRFRINKLSGDHTGLGRGVMPILRRLLPDAAIEEVNFNLNTKEEMVMGLKTLMEQQNIWLQQDDKQLQAEIRNMRRDLHPSGRADYHGEPHDDMFWALALAARGGAYKPFAIYSIGASRSIKL